MQHSIRAERLVKVYKKRRVVDEVSLEATSGEIVGLLGANGAGKTTTFYMITGLVRPDSGQIFIDGENVTGLPLHRRSRYGLSYLPQEPSIFRKMSVEDNIMSILQLVPLTDEQRRERLEQLLGEFRIQHVRHLSGSQLSGGERRRVEIARSLVTRPKFILLDEPFAGIDPISVADIQDMIRYLSRQGVGIIITDHNVREILSIVDRAYIINEGRLLLSGVPEVVAADPLARKYFLGDNFSI
ncbi:MAG: LPS export ABC transporter ATP-binding protein [Negativicutes bacterium]|nr:LPS export ABC transporter ATP-binding protein [Negativicutes bacterium]